MQCHGVTGSTRRERPLGSPGIAAAGRRCRPRGCGVCDAAALQVCLRYYEHELMELACQCPAVVCCRCSPTQKARIVKLLQTHAHKRTCAIGERRAPWSRPAPPLPWARDGTGRLFSSQRLSTPGDGGNDVSMIQAADCGIGIEGKVRVYPATRRGARRVLVRAHLRACAVAPAPGGRGGWPGALPPP